MRGVVQSRGLLLRVLQHPCLRLQIPLERADLRGHLPHVLLENFLLLPSEKETGVNAFFLRNAQNQGLAVTLLPDSPDSGQRPCLILVDGVSP